MNYTCGGNYVNVQRGMLICGGYNGFGHAPSNLGIRNPIVEFTKSSRKRLGRYLRNAKAVYKAFLTLTYPPGYGGDARTCKRELDAVCKRYERHCRQRGGKQWSIVWWQEWQENGRLHYHLLGTHFLHYRLLAKWWYDIVGSGNPKHLAAGTQIKKLSGKSSQISRYAVKYAVKSEQKLVPKYYGSPGRFWGKRGLTATVEASVSWRDWKHEEPYVQHRLRDIDSVRLFAQALGEMRLILVDAGNGRKLRIWLWDMDDPFYLDWFTFHVEQLRLELLEVTTDGRYNSR